MAAAWRKVVLWMREAGTSVDNHRGEGCCDVHRLLLEFTNGALQNGRNVAKLTNDGYIEETYRNGSWGFVVQCKMLSIHQYAVWRWCTTTHRSPGLLFEESGREEDENFICRSWCSINGEIFFSPWSLPIFRLRQCKNGYHCTTSVSVWMAQEFGNIVVHVQCI